MESIRVILAEDHHVVRAGVAAFLAREGDIEVVGEIEDISELMEMVEALKPDVVVLDAHMPGQRVIKTARQLHVQHPQVAVLILSAYNRREYVTGLLGAGALGYVLKDDRPQTLVRAVRALAQGRQWLSPRVMKVLLEAAGGEVTGPLRRLTEREREVLILMARGHTNEEIAKELVIAEQTVKNHVRNILSKLGVETRVQAVLCAIRDGLVSVKDLLG